MRPPVELGVHRAPRCEPVDYASTVPNTISDVHELLGVEAAAAVIHAELTATYATGGANNPR